MAKKKDNNNIYIPSLEAKDLHISNTFISGDIGYNLTLQTGDPNLKKYINTLDYSLDSIKLREVYKKIYRNNAFTFEADGKEYTKHVINVTFKYSVKEFNKINNNTYIKFGYNVRDLDFVDSICIVDGELVGVKVGVEVIKPVPDEVLGKYFIYTKGDNDSHGRYDAKKTIGSIAGVADLREKLYKDGFVCDGIRYVRFKRSSGSARVGKCLFIDERLYLTMRRWERCGLKIRDGQKIDLAAWESYISLTSSSIIGTLNIDVNGILLIDDYESVFEDDVIATRVVDDRLSTKQERVKIKNSIWDGETLIDKSIMGEYASKGMILLRERFFKSCCFNSNIQEWFKDNGITEISQLKGYTRAKNISEIKMITTPSSIKFLKFGDIDTWLDNIDGLFGVVKYEKQTHYMGGDMVQSHYQLINTLQLSEKEVEDLVKPSMDYIKMMRTEPAALRKHLSFRPEAEVGDIPFKTRNDVVYKMMTVNDKFIETKIFHDFLRAMTAAFMDNLRKGHVLINGNYSTMLGNPIEMLQASIGKFNGKSVLQANSIVSSRFEPGEKILGSRSPHVTMGNVLLVVNKTNELINRYINTTKEIVVINSIGENILNRLSGAD